MQKNKTNILPSTFSVLMILFLWKWDWPLRTIHAVSRYMYEFQLFGNLAFSLPIMVSLFFAGFFSFVCGVFLLIILLSKFQLGKSNACVKINAYEPRRIQVTIQLQFKCPRRDCPWMSPLSHRLWYHELAPISRSFWFRSLPNVPGLYMSTKFMKHIHAEATS